MEQENDSTAAYEHKVHPILNYFLKMRGYPRTAPLQSPPPFDIFISWMGTFLGIGVVAILSMVYNMPMLVASFGASAVLLYGVPDAPLSQPRNVFFGHILSAAIGVMTYQFFGLTWWSAALGTAIALGVMLITKTTHPPGGATALVAILNKATPQYILTPVAAGVIILIAIAIITNNLSPNRSYPRYWV
ncbi:MULTISPECIES: HPP family protein [Desulfosporosinus]|uniref:HPP family protein n=1 Tax=Desulfosporosinus TaxID=79206 RepID=UPI00069CA7C4|nr:MULTISPECIES: HPP family protein [Desulfosporosinus]